MIVLTDPDPAFRTHVRGLLDGAAEPIVDAMTLDELWGCADSAAEPVVAVLGPGVPHDDALGAVTQATSRSLGAILFVQTLEPAMLRAAMRAGAADVLTPDVSAQELADALDRAKPDAGLPPVPHVDPDPAEHGTVVTVFSTKGGSGKSLVATNLAVLLAQDHDVVLVDLSMQSGDDAIMLQMLPRHTIADVAQVADRLDAGALDGYLTTHESGVQLLAAPHDPALADTVKASTITRILELARLSHDVVIVDAPPYFNEHVLAALDLTDRIVLLGSMDVPSVKNLRIALTTLQQLGNGRDRVVTVLNRADSSVGLRVAEIEKSLDTKIDVQIPSSRAVPTSINRGMPLAQDQPKSPVVLAIAEIIPKILQDAAETTRSKSRFWSR